MKYECEICHAPMEKEASLLKHKTRGGNRCRRTRYKCTFCEYRKTVYADGWIDEVAIPQMAVDEANKMYRQEEENRCL